MLMIVNAVYLHHEAPPERNRLAPVLRPSLGLGLCSAFLTSSTGDARCWIRCCTLQARDPSLTGVHLS